MKLALSVLAALVALPLSAAVSSALVTEVRKNFAAWDLDHDGELTRIEVEKAVASPDFEDAAAAAIATLRRVIAAGKDQKVPRFTLANLEKLVPASKGKDGVPDTEAMFNAALEKIGTTSDLFDPGRLSLDNLAQGKLGDCFCLAPLGALLHRDPQDVVRMFSVTNDAHVSVTLGGSRVLRVPFPTDAERALMADTGGSGAWANCYEKAVGSMRRDPDDTEHPTEVSVVTRGGSAGTMLSIVTGHEIERASCIPFQDKKTSEEDKARLLDDIRAKMKATQAAHRLICGGTGSGKTSDGHRPPGVRGPHAYAVLRYDETTDTVTLWDPHGDDYTPEDEPPGLRNGYPRQHGRVTVPLKELVLWFGGFSFETDRALKD